MKDRELERLRRGALFARLTPPPGGGQRLRAALQRRPAGVRSVPRAALAGAALGALAAIAWWLPREPSQFERALAELRPRSVHVEGGAVLELPSNDDRVRVYVVTARRVGE